MSTMEEVEVPSYFLCPISMQIMKDPVTLSSGITYDRESIEKWLFSGKNSSKNTCPVTKLALSGACDITPNHTLRRLIQAWCTMNASHGVERIPTPKPPVAKTQIAKLLKDARFPHLQKNRLQQLKSIASESETNKRSMEASGAVEFLASLIVDNVKESSSSDEGLQDALSLLHNLRVSDSGTKTILLKEEFIESLIVVLQKRSCESRAYAIFLLQSIFEVADPMQLISTKPQLFVEIVQFLKDRISYQALKASLKTLTHLCPWGRNRVKAVEAGAVPVLIELLLQSPERRVCEMLMLLLDTMTGCAEGRAEFVGHGAGLAVVSKKILRVSQVVSERAVRILLSVSKYSATPGVVQDMLQLGVAAKLCLVLQVDGGNKIKGKAREILKIHAWAWKNSPCIPMNLHSSYP